MHRQETWYGIHMTNHTGHNHPATPAGRAWCRKLRLGDRPVFATFDPETTRDGWFVNAVDNRGRSLDLNGTPEGDVFQVWSASDAVWVVQNLRYGVDHDWDAETHTMRRVAQIDLRPIGRSTHTPSGWAVSDMVERHTYAIDGTRLTTEIVKDRV